MKAPIIFILLVMISFGAAFYLTKWWATGTIEALNQRLALKDDQITDYRERLHLLPNPGQAWLVGYPSENSQER